MLQLVTFQQFKYNFGPVERIEMNSGNSCIEELPDLIPGMGNAHFLYRRSSSRLIRMFQFGKKFRWDRCATQGYDSFYDLQADDRQDTWNDQLGNSRFTCPLHKGVIQAVVEKQLGYCEVCSSVKLQLQIGEIGLMIYGIGMYFGVSGNAYAH